MHRLIPVLALLVACSVPLDPIDLGPMVRPTAVSTVEMPLRATHPLPEAWSSSSRVPIATDGELGTVTGSPLGIHLLDSTGFRAARDQLTEVVDFPAAPVHSVLRYDGMVLAAGDAGLLVWDGQLMRSTVQDVLEGEVVQTLARQAEDLWLGTDLAVWRYAAGELARVVETGRVIDLRANDLAEVVVVRLADGRTLVVESDADEVRVQVQPNEPAMQVVVPDARGALTGLSGGALYRLVEAAQSDAQVWRRMALSANDQVGASQGIEALTGAADGTLWAVDAQSFYALRDTVVEQSPRPTGSGYAQRLTATDDGNLWLRDRDRIQRFGAAGDEVVTWCEMNTFTQANCAQCHPGQALDLSTESAWRENIDEIVRLVEAFAMPKNNLPLNYGTPTMPRRWLTGGLLPCAQ
jgi:hypothetical protein